MTTTKEDSPSQGTDESASTDEHLHGGRNMLGVDDTDNEEFVGPGTGGHDDRVVTRAVQAKNVIADSHIHIMGDLVMGEENRVAVPVADITRSVTVSEGTFVEPSYFADFEAALASPSVVALVGVSCGKRTAAGVALKRTGYQPILQLPADTAVSNLVAGARRVCKRFPKAGILVEGVDQQTLDALAGFEMRRLEEMLSGGAALIFTSGNSLGSPHQTEGMVAFKCCAPDLAQIIERAGGSPDSRQRAIAALEHLHGHTLSPGDALELHAQAERSEDTAQELAEAFDGTSTDRVLDEWLGAERAAEQVSALAAAAALDGAPIVDVDRCARLLSGLLSGLATESGEETRKKDAKTFTVADRGWPTGMLTVAKGTRGTHFGRQPIETAAVCPPHTRSRIVSYLWRHLGADFRGPLVAWLRQLADDSNTEIRLDTAVSAGVLLTIDPITAERDLIRPWALDASFTRRMCAAVALGAPIALGADPAGARLLTRHWSASENLHLRHTAVLAYGGFLGAWDVGSAAAAHLWRIGNETPQLTRSTNACLASLTSAGGSAARARGAVVGLLCAQADVERAPRRVYSLLPLILGQLTAPNDLSRDSLMALTRTEDETLMSLTELMARALTASSGRQSCRLALEGLLGATADGRVDHQTCLRIIECIRHAARKHNDLQALDAQARRVLWANTRQPAPLADVARFVLNECFQSS